MIGTRAARLSAVGIAACALSTTYTDKLVVAIDGSVFEFYPNFEKRIKIHKNEKLITDCKEADQINLNIKDNSEQYFNRIRQPNYNYQSGIESYFNKFVSSEGQIDPIYNNPNFLFEFDEVNANDNEVKYLNSENVEQNFSEKEIKKLLKNKEGYIKINIKDWEKEVLQSERIKVIANEYKYKIINDEESLISDKINSHMMLR